MSYLIFMPGKFRKGFPVQTRDAENMRKFLSNKWIGVITIKDHCLYINEWDYYIAEVTDVAASPKQNYVVGDVITLGAAHFKFLCSKAAVFGLKPMTLGIEFLSALNKQEYPNGLIYFGKPVPNPKEKTLFSNSIQREEFLLKDSTMDMTDLTLRTVYGNNKNTTEEVDKTAVLSEN